MYKKNSQLYYSPSDLTRFMESPFASWMDRLLIECPDSAPKRDAQDELMHALAQKGYEHEDALKVQFTEQGLSVHTVEGVSHEAKRIDTLEAMHEGVDVIVQARLERGQLAGYADFLIKVAHSEASKPSLLGDYHYEIWDSKLSSTIKPSFVVQLCCYIEMLEVIQGLRPNHITLALGNGVKQRLKTNDFYCFYRSLKSAFLEDQKNFDPHGTPNPENSSSWGDWSDYAEKLLLEKDHLSQVATITRSQIKKLNKAGLNTMQALADTKLQSVLGVYSEVFLRLQSQATIQKQSEGKRVPKFKIIHPNENQKIGLALLPPYCSLDVFFDIEGYPLDEGGLEYLWGCSYFDNKGERRFIDFWAHNHEQEKKAFQDFIHWVYQRWQTDSSMHIYHYANYEIAACRKLMGRYGVCEHEVDQLLRNEVFVDLYKVVKGGVLLGEPRYSIKNVEHLYRGKRETEVGSGGDSVAVYEQWRELNQRGEQGATWQTSKILQDIRDYNIDDCDSTQELVDWLRVQQVEHSIQYLGKTESTEPEVKEDVTERSQLRESLLARAQLQRVTDPLQAQLTENLAWTLEFHRREAKPIFWRLFDRLGLSPDELLDDLDCLASCVRTQTEAFKPSPRARNLAYEYRFDSAQEFKGAQKQFYLLGVETDDGKPAKVTFFSEGSNLEKGLVVLQAKEEPPAVVSLIPDEFVNPNPIPQAIDQCVSDYERGLLSLGQCAIIDFLARAKPRFKLGLGREPGEPLLRGLTPEERLQEIIQAITHLDHSYLTIQGPPGAGKSYTGKHVIAELVKTGARVGIASNSHKAINNLLLSTAKYCKQQNISAFFSCTKDNEPELIDYGVAILKNNELANHIQPSCVVGTTAWGFAREDMANQLDYLFIDEAGQVAVANLIAMSRSTTNIILMGDQMQLGQPSQGSHPAESGLSVLDYLLHETPAIADDMGVFLATTYRMHSKVNQFISEYIYDGKLKSDVGNDQRVINVPSDYRGPLNLNAGLKFVPVEHEGNTQASDEEVQEIKKLAESLLGRTFHTGDRELPSRPIEWSDMLFVAPYNHQVSKLRMALGDQAKVGSVDKFQGQEAPIVFLSMCASDASESPRGLEFLFDKNRINVAISRAQTLAVVVGNPRLATSSVSNIEQLKLLNLFNAITESGC